MGAEYSCWLSYYCVYIVVPLVSSVLYSTVRLSFFVLVAIYVINYLQTKKTVKFDEAQQTSTDYSIKILVSAFICD